jgi:hypothetical protein
MVCGGKPMPIDPLHLTRLALILVGLAAAVIYRRDIQQALELFTGRGPRPPTGPLPANDSVLLLRKPARPKLPRAPHIHQK